MFGHDNQDEQQQDEIIPTHYGGVDDQGDDQQIQPVAPSDDMSISTDDPVAVQSSEPAATPTVVAPAQVPAPAETDDLLNIKQEALQALTPLVGQLDQTPEEQFRTTMMMIQASDDHALVKVAYQAAQKISNEKERAQALLDIVNEINYFTQHAQA